LTQAIYRPDVFEVRDESEARSIILTPEGGTTDERWRVETPYLVEDIRAFVQPGPETLVLDFGCGIGRIARGLIETSGCSVIGYDISRSMRSLSLQYVQSERFTGVSSEILATLIDRGLRVDACVSVWVLQHCIDVEREASLIDSILRDGGHFYVVNNESAAIPTHLGWVDDGTDIRSILERRFALVGYSRLPREVTTEVLVDRSFIGKFRKRQASP